MSAPLPPSSRTRRLFKPLLLLAVLAVAAIAWRVFAPAPADKAAPAAAATPVRVATVVREDLVVRLKALGTVTPLHTVSLRSRVEGELLRLAFREGQHVNAGDLIAEIDPRPYQVQLARALGTQQQNLAELDNAQTQLRRFVELQSKHFVSAQELSDQQSRVRQLQGRRQTDQAAVDEARLQLQYTRITAPVAGRMGLRNVDVGNLVRSGDTEPLATITQTMPISVLFTVPEPDLPAVVAAVRTTPQLTVEAWDREERQALGDGVLSSLDNRIDTATGTLKLRAQFANADETLFPNQFVNIRLQVSSSDAVVIPNAAVQFGSKGTYVYVIAADDTSHLRNVVLGPADGERVSVREGLRAGERVVVEGIDGLREGAKVEVVAQDPARTGA
ncbi:MULTISPECIES: MdtA/MuxA family multidrug efflux RND transporter periplasmic adaptor subunit [Stenotrophomonas]|jgi:multidrug efflux system membrane fusion protein|uniref:MdtA/MuxA family multidrug efflux RND transporter periplasmic adaptor subunit n=1 Tax=Stenotrophomonas maltophilia TaxID=40324 RepID=A0A4S2CZB7_STEMA|nr:MULTISPECIES: MdtA/MuxA family multidrug efflux RND transporter periplasmic adaptor subunit [Stenotrophomonas]MBD3827681.1 MdtA/MuxA family multidrug efflux RND transporter periplasmic adaptor subunit [Stenotrophomonas sp.]TGY34458.1 MdtA/MuxA family multidrug efflux RND transporter periplasmic adaptor subunit [Stenotrophomonas maltophilia]